jgi:hypothetical protein
MQNTDIKLLLSSILVLTFAAYSNHDHLKNPDTWIGNYNFEEEPVKAIAGYDMAMVWTLSITKIKDKYQGVLEVNGQQTYIKLLSDISGDTNSIAITFNSLIEGTDEHLKRGDTLFVLSRTANKIETNWSALEPRLSEKHAKKCTCFTSIINTTN